MDAQMIKDVLQSLAPAVSVVGATVGIVNLLLARAKSSQEKRTKVLTVAQAIRAAIENTELYLGARSSGEPRDRDREKTLASLWSTAGAELEKIAETDRERKLADTLCKKGFSWDYTGQWPDEKVLEHGIDFTSVKSQLLELDRFLKSSVA